MTALNSNANLNTLILFWCLHFSWQKKTDARPLITAEELQSVKLRKPEERVLKPSAGTDENVGGVPYTWMSMPLQICLITAYRGSTYCSLEEEILHPLLGSDKVSSHQNQNLHGLCGCFDLLAVGLHCLMNNACDLMQEVNTKY